MLKIKGGVFSQSATLQFSLEQEDIRFNYGKDFSFSCSKSKDSVAKLSIEEAKKNVFLDVKNSITFPYLQSEEVELMRTLYFQDKKIYDASSKLEAKLPWCSLRIQLSRNEDTIVKKGESFSPVSYNRHNNNSYFTTHSYSFVDFATGKKKGAQLLYNPFMFNCNVLQGMSFNADTLESIVGHYLKMRT